MSKIQVVSSNHHNPPLSTLNIISCRSRTSSIPGPVGMKEFTPWLIHTLILVSTEIVTLCLQKIRRKALAAKPVEIVQSRGKRRYGDTIQKSSSTNPSPALLCRLYCLFEEGGSSSRFSNRGLLSNAFLISPKSVNG